MFDLSWSELLVIGVVALIAIGPKELPGVLRMVGQWMGKVRRMAAEFQGQFQEAMREAEMADIKKQVDEIADTAQSYTNFDPLADISKQFETSAEDKPAASAVAPDTSVSETSASETVAPDAPVATAPPAPENANPSVPQDNAQTASAAHEPVDPPAQAKAGSGA
jgi:sec-independent protein translocase protein TatB